MSFSTFQNASSRLTLVLWPATTVERLTIEDFMLAVCVLLLRSLFLIVEVINIHFCRVGLTLPTEVSLYQQT
jgi:hypothetical protein